VEDKRNDALKLEKVLEERLRQALAEKERAEKLALDKLKQLQTERDTTVAGLEQRAKRYETLLRAREEEAIRKAAEFDKLQALIDQKLQLTERELAECRAKLVARECELKDLTKEMYSAKKETQALQA